MADYGTLKVSPEQLMASVELAFKNIEACRDALEKISSTIAATGDYWQGDGAETARETYASQASTSIESLNELAAYPQDLLQSLERPGELRGEPAEGIYHVEQA